MVQSLTNCNSDVCCGGVRSDAYRGFIKFHDVVWHWWQIGVPNAASHGRGVETFSVDADVEDGTNGGDSSHRLPFVAMVVFHINRAVFTTHGDDGVGRGDAPDGGIVRQGINALPGLAHVVGEVQAVFSRT